MNKAILKTTALAGILVMAGAATGGCATKGFVRNEVAVVDGRVADDVREAIVDAIPVDGTIREVDAQQGRSAEVAVVLFLAPGLDKPSLDDAVRGVQEALAASAVVADRVDSLEIRLATG